MNFLESIFVHLKRNGVFGLSFGDKIQKQIFFPFLSTSDFLLVLSFCFKREGECSMKKQFVCCDCGEEYREGYDVETDFVLSSGFIGKRCVYCYNKKNILSFG